MPSLWPHGGLWRHPDFLRLWAAQVISAFGSRITRTALPVIAVLSLSGSPMEVALLAAITAGPAVLIGLVAGGPVDRSRKRPILIAADVVRAIAVGTVPVAAWLDALTVAHIYVVAVIVGAASALFHITDVAFLPALVGRRHIVDGNAKLEATEAIAEITGPGAAGILISVFGAPLAVLIDAATYVWSALFLRAIRQPEAPPANSEEALHWRRDVAVGMRTIMGNPLVRPLFLAAACSTVGSGFFMALYMIYTLSTLALGTAAVGLIIGVGGIGALGGALVSRRLPVRLGLGPAMIVALTVNELSGLLIPLAGYVSRPLTLSFLISHQLFGDGFRVAYAIHAVSVRQTVLPLAVLGRVNAAFQLMSGFLLPAGALAAGVLAETLGVHAAIWIGSGAGLIAPLVLLCSPIRTLRTMPAGEHETDGTLTRTVD